MFAETTTASDLAALRHFLMAERQKTLSDTEWKFRMRGYGFQVRRVTDGVIVARIPSNEILGCVQM